MDLAFYFDEPNQDLFIFLLTSDYLLTVVGGIQLPITWLMAHHPLPPFLFFSPLSHTLWFATAGLLFQPPATLGCQQEAKDSFVCCSSPDEVPVVALHRAGDSLVFGFKFVILGESISQAIFVH